MVRRPIHALAVLMMFLMPAAQAAGARAHHRHQHHVHHALAKPGPAAGGGVVTLVNPDGSPLGGTYPRWVSTMRVPSVAGDVVVEDLVGTACDPNGNCHGVCRSLQSASVTFDCTPAAALAGAPVFGEDYSWDAANQRLTAYHELGHIFDDQHLTQDTRVELEALMHERGQVWQEVGPRDDFAEIYAFCAANYDPRPSWSPTAVWLTTPQDTAAICRLIIARARQGGMPAPYAPDQVP